MSFIYCITNIVNGKQYVGKTTITIKKRFKQHISDSKKKRCENRPLYKAFHKYGIDNFKIDILEEVLDNTQLSNKEQYWIQKLNTYHYGYNATKGGDGTIIHDYNKIIDLYKQNLSMLEVSKQLGCCTDTISKVIHGNNIKLNNISIGKEYLGSCNKPKAVQQINGETNDVINTFASIADAAKYCVNNGYAKTYNGGVRQHISNSCKCDCVAYGFKWQMIK